MVSALRLDELLTGLGRQEAQVPAEIGAFLVLQACERVLDKPCVVGLQDVLVLPDGGVRVEGVATDAEEAQLTEGVLSLLRQVAQAAGKRPPPGIERLLDDSARQLSLDELRNALVAALVPLNRGASRRVLSRLWREAATVDSASTTRAARAQSLGSQGDSLPVGSADRVARSSPTPRSSPSAESLHAWESQANAGVRWVVVLSWFAVLALLAGIGWLLKPSWPTDARGLLRQVPVSGEPTSIRQAPVDRSGP